MLKKIVFKTVCFTALFLLIASLACAGRTTRDLVFEEEQDTSSEGNNSQQSTTKSVISVKTTIELDRNGEKSTVLPTASFLSGDKITINYTPNTDAYVYWLTQGASGKYFMLFPTPKTGTDNFIKKNQVHSIPVKGSFKFDENAGTEKILLVLSGSKIPELEKAAQEAAVNGGAVSESSADVSKVSESQQSKRTTRDLVFEEDDNEETGVQTVKQSSEDFEPMVVYYELVHQ
jgi:hypothetical protein